MTLNQHQKEYVEYLHSLKPEDKCWCGWYKKEECWSGCEYHGKGFTCADKLARNGRLHFRYCWESRFWIYGGYWLNGWLHRHKCDDP